jgi:RluA family pseudouridine synthase
MTLMGNIQNLLLYRDACMLVLNKPAGIQVHQGPYKGEHLEQYFESLRFGLPRNPTLAHRLDRDTSGCLVLGRHAKAMAKLGSMFKNGRIHKTYLAEIQGKLPEPAGEIHLPLLKIGEGAKWKIIVDDAGQKAHTSYEVLEVRERTSFVKLTPHTGRTHQLRIHMREMGTPIVGDWKYGHAGTDEKMMLHAWHIEIPYYQNKPAIKVTAPLPEHFVARSPFFNHDIV